MRRSIFPLFMTVMAAFPIGNAWGTAHAASLKSKVVTKKYKGPVEYMRWGPVQATVSIKGKRITNVSASVPTERPRSMFINQQAVPMLRQEVLQAQSATIDVVSGATLTSEAFAQSLQGALKKAHFKKA